LTIAPVFANETQVNCRATDCSLTKHLQWVPTNSQVEKDPAAASPLKNVCVNLTPTQTTGSLSGACSAPSASWRTRCISRTAAVVTTIAQATAATTTEDAITDADADDDDDEDEDASAVDSAPLFPRFIVLSFFPEFPFGLVVGDEVHSQGPSWPFQELVVGEHCTVERKTSPPKAMACRSPPNITHAKDVQFLNVSLEWERNDVHHKRQWRVTCVSEYIAIRTLKQVVETIWNICVEGWKQSATLKVPPVWLMRLKNMTALEI
jgi:hypothetical protein